MIKIDVEKLNTSLENEKTRAKQAIEDIKKIKDEKFRNLMDIFKANIKEIKIVAPKRFDLKEIRKEAMKTIRKLPLLGYTNDNKLEIDFYWPKEQEILQIPEEKPIEAVGFNWHKADYDNGNYIGGLQVILSNGQTSPVFLCKD